SADLQSAVSPSCTRQNVELPVCSATRGRPQIRAPQIANLRYGRVQLCATGLDLAKQTGLGTAASSGRADYFQREAKAGSTLRSAPALHSTPVQYGVRGRMAQNGKVKMKGLPVFDFLPFKLSSRAGYTCSCLMKFRVVSLCAACLMPVFGFADSPVVFNEVMYHPLTNELQLEWVELQNQLAVDMDLSHWRLEGGISFNFPEGTVIRAGEYLVVAAAPSTLSMATGFTNSLGPFIGRLSNAGEELRLRNNNDRVMDELRYGVEGDWPVAPDGAGPSLARRRTNLLGSDARNWLSSAQLGGTPGAANFSPDIEPRKVAFN